MADNRLALYLGLSLNQPPEVINARLKNASHDFLTTDQLCSPTRINRYNSTTSRNYRPRAHGHRSAA